MFQLMVGSHAINCKRMLLIPSPMVLVMTFPCAFSWASQHTYEVTHTHTKTHTAQQFVQQFVRAFAALGAFVFYIESQAARTLSTCDIIAMRRIVYLNYKRAPTYTHILRPLGCSSLLYADVYYCGG